MTKLVYVWRRPDGTPFYVGIGCDRRPWRKERNRRVNSIRASVEKAGGQVTVEVVSEHETVEQALAEEVRLIAEYGRLDLGTGTLANMTPGGDVGVTFTPEVLRRMREAKLGVPNPRVAEAMRGRKASANQLAGLAHGRGPKTKETRAKISAALTGRKLEGAELERVRTMNLGRTPTEEARQKMSKAQKSRKRPPCSPETRAKISAALTGRKRVKTDEEAT